MTTATDIPTERVITYEITPRLTVDVPVRSLESYHGGKAKELTDDEILEIISEDTDLVPNAVAALFEEQNFSSAYVDVSRWQDAHDAPIPERVTLIKPSDGIYTLPVPNLITGNVIFTEDGIVDVEVSNVNVLSDDQLEGAYYAGKRIWGLRGMHRYQKEQIAELLSELQWAMLARPSRHVFIAGDNRVGDLFSDSLCLHCNQVEEGHLVRDEKGSEDA